MLRTLALVSVISATGCRCNDQRQPSPDPSPDPPPAAATIGSGPSPVYPKRVPLESPLRPDSMRAVPGTSLAAVSGEIDGKPALQLVDVDAGRVVWTDTQWCIGRLVHATPARLLCAGGKGVQAIGVADGKPAWSTPRRFRAAGGDRVLAGAALLDATTGKPVRVADSEPPYLKFAQAVCPDGAIYAWLQTGVVMRLTPELGIAWNQDLGAAPMQVEPCGETALVEVAGTGEERSLFALDPSTGERVAEPVPVLGWWTALDGDGIVIANAAGVHRRTRSLADPRPIAPARAAGRALADGPGLRLVRTAGGTLLLLDADGIRAWLAAPTAPRFAVVTAKRLLSAGWAVDRSAGERLQLYELPSAPMPWPDTPLQRRAPAALSEAALTELPAPTDTAAATQVADAGRGNQGVAAVALGDAAIYTAVLEQRPSASYGAALAAFDLRKRAWVWHQPEGCAVDTSVVQIAAAGGAVVCATRTATETGELVAVDAATGAPRWRASFAAIDRLAAAGDHLVAFAGERALVLDPATGQVAREIVSDNGHAPRVAVVPGGVVAVEQGDIVGPGWRVEVAGHVAALGATEDAVLASLVGGALYVIDPKSGRAREVEGWSASPDLIVAGDRFFDVPESPEGTYVVRGWGADGVETLRVILPVSAHVAPMRSAGAPVLLVDDRPVPAALAVDPVAGTPLATHAWPAGGLREGAFSTVVDGAPVVGVVLRRPLSVHLFPR